jgi:mannose PTS system EIIA component
VSVGVLLVTHEGLATSLIAAARRVMPIVPLKLATFEVGWVCDPESVRRTANQALREIDQGNGVLMLIDLYGATPANSVQHLEIGREIRRVSGLNLPMLLRVLNYPELNLDELAKVAREGGRAGIIDDNG